MSRPLKRRYKPIGFGDPYDSRSVEGHINQVNAAREERQFRKLVEERQAEREAMKPLHVVFSEKIAAWLRKIFRMPTAE
jgi:hypothetical protein